MGAEARQTLSPELRTEVFPFPASFGIPCPSGNARCRPSCGPQAHSFFLPSSSHVADVGTQEQEVLGETRQDRRVKASSTPKRCISRCKGGSHPGKRHLCQKPGQGVNCECASVPKVSIKHSVCRLLSLRWQVICHFPSCCFMAGLRNVLCVT